MDHHSRSKVALPETRKREYPRQVRSDPAVGIANESESRDSTDGEKGMNIIQIKLGTTNIYLENVGDDIIGSSR